MRQLPQVDALLPEQAGVGLKCRVAGAVGMSDREAHVRHLRKRPGHSTLEFVEAVARFGADRIVLHFPFGAGAGGGRMRDGGAAWKMDLVSYHADTPLRS